jgi:mono/diheme cytochrome c family protein
MTPAPRRLLLGAATAALLIAAAVLSEEEPGTAPQARDLLASRCYACHGKNGAAARGIFVLDRERLIGSGILKPGDPTSPLLRAVESGAMPLAGARLTPAETSLLRRWVLAGAPDWSPAAAPPAPASPDARSESALIAEIRRDLEAAPPAARRFYRYLSLAHLRRAGVPEIELAQHRTAVSLLLNSLSWAPTIARPAQLGPAADLLRIDLRALKWDAGAWRRILADYPYGIDSPAAESVNRDMGTELPYVRGDWLVAHASVPPLYHDLLGLPDRLEDLEERLGLDTARAVREGSGVLRAGIRASGVSRSNRVVERHALPWGAYWRSYDFKSSQGERDIFRSPVDLHPDGGEIIFSLPNGLQAYFVVDRRGRRLDRAPVAIVADRSRPEEPEIVNGRSCIGCHTVAMKSLRDEIRPLVERAATPPFDRERALALYPPQARLERALTEDADRFRRAAEQAGGRASADARDEPVTSLASRFAADLTSTQAASELGLDPAEFRARLARSPRLAQLGLGGLLQPAGGVKREVWEEQFAAVPVEMGLGEPAALSAGPRGGVLLVAADDLPTSFDAGSRDAPAVARFIRNAASFLTRGRAGRLLIHTAHPSFGPSFQEVLSRAGHTVDQALAPVSLSSYDAVFSGGDGAVDPAALADYVAGGGKLYLAAGTGDIPGEASFWDPLLRRFGLRLWEPGRARTLRAAAFAPGPLFRGVESLPLHQPNPIALLPGDWPGTRILATAGPLNAWALFTTDPSYRDPSSLAAERVIR